MPRPATNPSPNGFQRECVCLFCLLLYLNLCIDGLSMYAGHKMCHSEIPSQNPSTHIYYYYYYLYVWNYILTTLMDPAA